MRNIILPITTDPAMKVDVGAIKHSVFYTHTHTHTLDKIVRPWGPLSHCQVGRIKCPLLLVNGDDDQNWATTESAEDVSSHTHSSHSHTRADRHTDRSLNNRDQTIKQHHLISISFLWLFVGKPSHLHSRLFNADARLQMLSIFYAVICIHHVDYDLAVLF